MDSVNCPGCEAAAVNPRTRVFGLRSCDECGARFLAQSPQMAEAAAANAITPRYRDALVARWGDDWRLWHLAVKRWAERIGR